MCKRIVFKANPIRSRDRFYVYIPKVWTKEIENVRRQGKKLIVTIEAEDYEE